jgi:squalene-hopene/tetraprenyl-beta-curcumene cyclase
MGVLERMQPASGGYLEATPLTAFVVMSLAATGRGSCPVARRGLTFLECSVDDRGRWPIDTNLATWVTSLSVEALSRDPDDDGRWCDESLVGWHLGCQHRERHPYTGAESGGWGWSDLSGAVPDSDDTPGAILALEQMRPRVGSDLRRRIDAATRDGAEWLLKLQNRNGGWPTFCRGWGKLPFDRSSTDLTAHAIRALVSPGGPPDDWQRASADAGPAAGRKLARAVRAGVRFLHAEQRRDGAWLPLWFGNQDDPNESNPVYGTARVLLLGPGLLGDEATRRGLDFLLGCQNPDGGWGGGPSVQAWLQSRSQVSPESGVTSSIEETALAVDALARCHAAASSERRGVSDRTLPAGAADQAGTSARAATGAWGGGTSRIEAAIIRGVDFLLSAVAERRHDVPWPIGFYFAKLWYHERLYPLIFSVAALGSYLRLTAETKTPAPTNTPA